MRLISKIEDIKIQEPNYSCSRKYFLSDIEICLYEVGYEYLCSINNSTHIIKDMYTKENLQITNKVFDYLYTIGEEINDSY